MNAIIKFMEFFQDLFVYLQKSVFYGKEEKKDNK